LPGQNPTRPIARSPIADERCLRFDANRASVVPRVRAERL
jgi:hypothetical protein